MQDFLTYTILILAVAYLVNKFFLPKKKNKKGCGDGNCGCN